MRTLALFLTLLAAVPFCCAQTASGPATGTARPQGRPDSLFTVYQLSGMVLEPEDGMPVTYVRIAVRSTRRGCFSTEMGFYSLPVIPTDTLQVSRLGYKTMRVAVADLIRDNLYPAQPYLYSVLFLEPDPVTLPTQPIYPYRNAHEITLAFRNIPIPTENPMEMSADNLRPGMIAQYVEGLPVDPNDELAIAQQQYLAHYATRKSIPYVSIVDPVAIVKLIQYVGKRNEAQRNRVLNYWPE